MRAIWKSLTIINEKLLKVLDLRGSFVDNQTEFVEKLKIANESLTTLREEVNAKVDKLDTTLTRKLEAKVKSSSDSSDFSKKLDLVKTNVEASKTEMNKVLLDNQEKALKKHLLEYLGIILITCDIKLKLEIQVLPDTFFSCK